MIRNEQNLPTQEYLDTVKTAMKGIFKGYDNIGTRLETELLSPVDVFISELDDLSSDLKSYLESLKMDETFIM